MPEDVTPLEPVPRHPVTEFFVILLTFLTAFGLGAVVTAAFLAAWSVTLHRTFEVDEDFDFVCYQLALISSPFVAFALIKLRDWTVWGAAALLWIAYFAISLYLLGGKENIWGDGLIFAMLEFLAPVPIVYVCLKLARRRTAATAA